MDRTISPTTYNAWRNQPILHDEDEWNGEYETYGEMWLGEGYTIKEDMSEDTINMIVQLLKNYDNILRDKGEHYADMMSDWIGSSKSEAQRYADKYATNRVERQRVHDVMTMIRE